MDNIFNSWSRFVVELKNELFGLFFGLLNTLHFVQFLLESGGIGFRKITQKVFDELFTVFFSWNFFD